MTHRDDPVAHIRTEFGFDVLQVAAGRYAPEGYRSFIGFQASKDVLERAFRDTYGIEMKDVFGNLTLALSSYRHTVSAIIPAMTRVAWSPKKDQLQKGFRHHPQKVSVQSLPLELRKGVGEPNTASPALAPGC